MKELCVAMLQVLCVKELCDKVVADNALCERVVCDKVAGDNVVLCVAMLRVKESCVTTRCV